MTYSASDENKKPKNFEESKVTHKSTKEFKMDRTPTVKVTSKEAPGYAGHLIKVTVYTEDFKHQINLYN